MLIESKSAWRQALLAGYLAWKYRQRFAQVRVNGFEVWQEWLTSEAPYPLIWFGNHQTWWDGLLDFSVTRHFGMDNRLMMEAKNLRQFSYFQKCGVFGVDLNSRRDRAEGLKHAVKLLTEPSKRRCLILYPHGRLTQPWESPSFQPGLAGLLGRAPGATALPIWRQMRFGAHELPSVDIEIGPPIPASDQPSQAALEQSLSQAQQSLQSRIDSGNHEGGWLLSRRLKSLRGET